MTDWIVPLLQVGGIGAVLFLALWIMGGWLLKRINAALDGYVTAYAQETAKIDARIERLNNWPKSRHGSREPWRESKMKSQRKRRAGIIGGSFGRMFMSISSPR